MKEKMGFRWGYRAEVYAAACVYVAIREDNREIWVQDVLVRLSLSPSNSMFALTRLVDRTLATT